MSTSYTYPGVYIQELQSNSHPITAAPTSVTVFVGYTHPFLTNSKLWGVATEIFSFTDYENQFGGLYTSGVIESHVAYAVNNFFLNGGSNAYIVALQPSYYDTGNNNMGLVVPPTLQVGAVSFSALQPIDQIPMTVTINNVQTTYAANDTADIAISYGPRGETYRKVNLKQGDPNYIVTRISSVSQLIKVTGTPSGAFTAIGQAPLGYGASAPSPDWTTFNALDFVPVFQQDSSLDKVAVFNIVTIPGIADSSIWSEALAFCERRMAFAIMDPPWLDSADGFNDTLPLIANDMQSPIIPKSTNGALYFPYLVSNDPLRQNPWHYPPSGYVAGMFATTDNNRGVWKAPAGLQTILNNTTGVVPSGLMTDARQGTLNPLGVNCLRFFPNVGGIVIWGSRTLVTANVAYEQWRYVPVRRMALFLEQTLYANLGWAVFEPNDTPLWVALRSTIEAFMLSLFNQGAFQGDTPSAAFQVLCDSSTTTQQDIDNGVVNILVAFAPLEPAEFVVVKIAQLAGQSQS